MFDNVWLIPLLPLIGFLINGLFGKAIKNEKVIGGIGAWPCSVRSWWRP